MSGDVAARLLAEMCRLHGMLDEANATVARVEALADEWDEDGMLAPWRACVATLRATLQGGRPNGCCGVCPPLARGGYDCTCDGTCRIRRRVTAAIELIRLALNEIHERKQEWK